MCRNKHNVNMVEKTRNSNTWTEARYFQQISNVLRQGFRFWKPIIECKKSARRAYVGDNPRQKWEYQCKRCSEWFTGKQVQVDHIVPVGKLRALEDLPGVMARLTAEGVESYQVLCKPCHQEKTNNEKNGNYMYEFANILV